MKGDLKIQLRKANIDDLDLLRYWDTKQHVIDSDPDDDWNWEIELSHEPSWREQLIAELEARPIGFIQIIDPAEEESHYWGEVEKNLRAIDIWIGEENDLAKGYGTEMITMAINQCFENEEVTAILIDPLESNTKAIRFYEKIGFSFVEKRSFHDSDCLVYKLDRADWSNG